MPLARQAMHDEGEDLHIALWPYAKETHHLASRHYAHEGRCYVIAVGQIMTAEELPPSLKLSDKIQLPENGGILRGGSAVYGPDASIILDPIYDRREIIYVDLDLRSAINERMNLAVSGHFQRHDILGLTVNNSIDQRR